MPNSASFNSAKVERKTGEEPFRGGGKEPALKLKDFWQWSVSDLLSNATRGILAEYLVAKALGLANGFRKEWAPYDLKTEKELKIEVKSFSPFQSWPQPNGLSKLSFGIRSTHCWTEEDGKTAKEIKHQADGYVFCILGAEEASKPKLDKDKVDPLNIHQWDFYVMKESDLPKQKTKESNPPSQKTIGEAAFKKLCSDKGIAKVEYGKLADAIYALSPH